MVELERILSERSDERILNAVREISDTEFNKLVEAVAGYLELKISRTKPKPVFTILECVHRPDGKKYVLLFSRQEGSVSREDIDSLVAYMQKADAPNALVLTTSAVSKQAAAVAEANNIGLADGTKVASLLRRFDLDKDVIRSGDAWKERAKVTSIPGADRQLEEAMKAGYETLASKEHMKALDHFDQAIMLKEDYDVPWRFKGNTLDEMGYHEQALECYKHALELYPESDETWFSLGACLFSLGRYNEEIICYDRALRYNPVMQKALINKGSTLHRLGRFQEAIEAYDKVLKINYRLEKVHNNRGATLHALGQLDEALASYNRAIELKHDYVEAWMNKGGLLFEMGRYQEALDAFTQMTQFRPELPKGWYLRGLAARKTGDVTKAKASFEAALRLDPESSDAKKALDEISRKIAERYTEVPRIVEDIFASEAAKASAPAVPEAEARVSESVVARVHDEKVEELAEELYGDRAEMLLLLGRLEEAFDFLGRSLRLEGDNAPLLTAAGNVLYQLGKLEAATRTYEHALTTDPSYAPAMLNLHAVLREQGEREKASEVSAALRNSKHGWQVLASAAVEAFERGDMKQALEDVDAALRLEDLAALQNLKGLLCLEQGAFDVAGQVFDKTMTMSLDESEAHSNRGVVHFKKNDIEKASFEFDRAIRLQRDNCAAWSNRGCVLYKVDRLREAVACFEESSMMRRTTVALTDKGFCQLSIDMLDEAVASFDNSLKVAETPEAFNNKGIALERMGKHDEASVAFKEALRIAPQFKDAADNLNRISSLEPVQPKREAERQPAPPSEEVLGDKESADALLEKIDEQFLREKKKSEIEAICESLGLNPRGTRADLVVRILRAKDGKA
ncbi:MAG: tetratricopeptide repeat protein [Candidatus Thermoplasmatota archaeon]|nr:tetratricopeptide repeat protein [Candidatus Thermoplasmatota archaeon]